MALDKRLTKSGNKFFDDSEELAIVVSDEVIEYDSSKISGGGGSSELEEKVAGLCEYSTQETDTHKEWIDGKRIYRKCYSGKTTRGNDFIIDTISNAETIVNMDVFINYGGDSNLQKCPIISADNTVWTSARFNTNNKQFILRAHSGSSVLDNWDYCAIIEYTKTE